MKKPDGPRRIVCLTEETTETLYLLGGIVGALSRADALVASLQAGLDQARATAARLPRRPRVYFEQWNQPLICGILQPGPAALTDGLRQLQRIITACAQQMPA